MKELKIGEEIRVRCVEGRNCDKCIFYDGGCFHMRCRIYERTDHKNVHFELAEDNGCPSDETIMRVLNCIGFEERSWIDTVKKNWDKTKEG